MYHLVVKWAVLKSTARVLGMKVVTVMLEKMLSKMGL